MPRETLRELIERHIVLGRESSTGFHGVKCQLCNDHVIRAGFKFNGDEVGYSCFNCGAKARGTDGSGAMRKVLYAFGITRDDLQRFSGGLFIERGGAVQAKPAPAPIPFDPYAVLAKIKASQTKVEVQPSASTSEISAAHLAKLRASYPNMEVTCVGTVISFTPKPTN